MTNIVSDLQFTNYEIVQIHSVEDDVSRWHFGIEEGKFRAHVDDQKVEFRLVLDDGTDFASQDKSIERHWVNRSNGMLGKFIVERAMRYEGEDWQWYASSVPSIESVSRLGDEVLHPLGAHELPIKIVRGKSSADVPLPSPTVVETIADGAIPAGATPIYFMHDMEHHALNERALEQQTMDAIQELCQFAAILLVNPLVNAKLLCDKIANTIDYNTFSKNFEAYTNGQSDRILTNILRYIDTDMGSTRKLEARFIINKFGFKITDKDKVLRPTEVTDYYSSLRHVMGLQKI